MTTSNDTETKTMNELTRETPRTDAVADICGSDSEHSDLQAYSIMRRHAEQLERELIAASRLPPSAEVVERVARALAAHFYKEYGLSERDIKEAIEDRWEVFQNEAKAALAAINGGSHDNG